jgi:hypothetical protein
MNEDEKQQRLNAIDAKLKKLTQEDLTHIPHVDRDPSSMAPVQAISSEGSTGHKERAKLRAELLEERRKLSE